VAEIIGISITTYTREKILIGKYGITVFGLLVALVLAGCAAKSTTKLVSKTQESFPRHREPVCMLRSPLPSNIGYTAIGEVRGGKQTYGSINEVLPVMADEAREIGADAIINLQTSHKMGAWAWARPTGSGIGVKLNDKSSFSCASHGGELR